VDSWAIGIAHDYEPGVVGCNALGIPSRHAWIPTPRLVEFVIAVAAKCRGNQRDRENGVRSQPLAHYPLSSDVLEYDGNFRPVLPRPQSPLVNMNLAGKRFGRCSPAGSHDDAVRLGHFTFGHPALQTRSPCRLLSHAPGQGKTP
jgi:hypothetical protein